MAGDTERGERIESFSGAHPFRPLCLAELLDDPDQVYDITAMIDLGHCPRCEERMLPQRPNYPAGSRVTRCRCIPICSACGSHEAFVAIRHPSEWPLYGVV
jgi:hypothetical protein